MINTMEHTTQPEFYSTPWYRNRKVLLIVLAVCIIAAIGFAVWYFVFRPKNQILTPEASLKALKETSIPYTAAPERRAVELESLQKNSAEYKGTSKEQFDALNALKPKS